MTAVVLRHFIMVGNRQVHYRRAGSGPPVLLLHQSPTSSAEMLSLMWELAGEFTVIAPDTPGNGLSDPLSLPAPTMDDYADAVAATLDALGIARAAVYGFHSGAGCALALAHRHPARVLTVIANGYTHLLPEERRELLDGYFPSWRIEWTGAYLLWAWARMRDQFIYFPWHRKSPQNRLRSGLPRLEVLQSALLDLLRAMDSYEAPYRAAFGYDRDIALRALRMPGLLMTAQTDALYPYLERLPTVSSQVRVERPRGYAEVRALLRDMLHRQLDGLALPPVPAAPAAAAPAGRVAWGSVSIAGASVLLRHAGAPRGRPLVLCHDSGASSAVMQRFMLPLTGQRPMIAVDLPGNGESDAITAEPISVNVQAAALAAALRELGCQDFDLLAEGGGASVATALALQQPRSVNSLMLVNAAGVVAGSSAEDTERAAAPLSLGDYGEHLVTAWNRARDALLFAPWHRHGRDNVLQPLADELDPLLIHQRALDLLKCRESLPAIVRAQLAYPLRERLSTLRQPVSHCAAPASGAGAAACVAQHSGFFGKPAGG